MSWKSYLAAATYRGIFICCCSGYAGYLSRGLARSRGGVNGHYCGIIEPEPGTRCGLAGCWQGTGFGGSR